MTDTRQRQAREAADRIDLEGAQRAGRDAFGHLYERHAPASWRLALIVGRDRGVAEGALVDAFARVLGQPDRRDALRFAPVGTQLLHATREAALDLARDVDEPTGLDRLGTHAHPGTVRAFDSLPERWRSVLWLRVVEGLDLATAAAVLGTTEQIAGQLATRALGGLREQFAVGQVHPTMPTGCHDTTIRLGGYVARALPERDAARVRRHLDRCEDCRTRLDEIDDLAPRLKDLTPALPIVIEALAIDAWLARATDGTGPLGLRLPSGQPVPAWAERALAGATAAVVSLGISAAVLFSGKDGGGGGVPIESASGSSPDGEQALNGALPRDDAFDAGTATVIAPTTPVPGAGSSTSGTSGTTSTGGTGTTGGTTSPTAGEAPRSAGPVDQPSPTAPPSAPGPTTPPSAPPTDPPGPTPSDEPSPVDEVVDAVGSVTDDVCTGVAAVDGLTGCQATESTGSGSRLGL